MGLEVKMAIPVSADQLVDGIVRSHTILDQLYDEHNGLNNGEGVDNPRKPSREEALLHWFSSRSLAAISCSCRWQRTICRR